jgi:hypothetical protein
MIYWIYSLEVVQKVCSTRYNLLEFVFQEEHYSFHYTPSPTQAAQWAAVSRIKQDSTLKSNCLIFISCAIREQVHCRRNYSYQSYEFTQDSCSWSSPREIRCLEGSSKPNYRSVTRINIWYVHLRWTILWLWIHPPPWPDHQQGIPEGIGNISRSAPTRGTRRPSFGESERHLNIKNQTGVISVESTAFR